MKSNLSRVSFALLSAVFILGCQDVGTGVVASDPPGPQFGLDCDGRHQNHPQCDPSKPNYVGTFSGDVASLGDILFGGNLGANSDGDEQSDFFMNLSFFKNDAVVSGGSTCFKNTENTRIRTLEISSSKHAPDGASVLITFDALGNKGEKVVNYGLSLLGTITSGELPPLVDTALEISWGPFDMHHSNGPGKKVACDGSGALPASHATVTRTR